MGEFLVSAELKDDYLDELQHSNNALVALIIFIFAIPFQLVKKTLSSLSVKDCELPFQFFFIVSALSKNNCV